MLALKLTSTTSVKSNLQCYLRSPAIAGTGKFGGVREIPLFSSGSRVKGRGSIRAVISGEDKNVKSPSTGTGTETGAPLKSTDANGSLPSSSSSGGIEVKAVVTIRKKMKEKLGEKMEDQWEFFINGIGQGILIQLISEEVDPGLYLLLVFYVVHVCQVIK